jgi:hypothetical protein
MGKFGWSYPPGVTGNEPEITGDYGPCAVCWRDPDAEPDAGGCDCEECPQCQTVGDPGCYTKCGLPPRPDSIAAFLDHIGIEPLSSALRAIDKHNLEHVWLVVNDGHRLYYHSDGLDSVPTWTRVERVGVGCIAWDGSDWEYSTEVEPVPWSNLDEARQWAHDALAAYQATARDRDSEQYDNLLDDEG